YYEKHDEHFERESEARARLDALFSQLLELPRGIAGTVFARPQVLFSLMLVLDGLKKQPKPEAVQHCIDDIDARVEAVRSGDNPKALTTSTYESFTGGNMHRIRSRRARQDAISRYF